MKRDGRKLDHRTLEVIRAMAIERVRAGERPSSVIRSYGFSRTTIYNWLKAAALPKVGRKASYGKSATGRPRRLTARQEQQVFHWINGNSPCRFYLRARDSNGSADGLGFAETLSHQYGLSIGLWTRRLVADLIERKFKVRLGLTAVGDLLAKLELTPQKGAPVSHDGDTPALEKWRDEIYPQLARRVKAQGGEICLWDDSRRRANATTGKPTHAKRSPVAIEKGSRRRSLRAASAVNSKGAFWYCTYQGPVTSEQFVALLKKLLRYRMKPLHLVVDSRPLRRTAIVNDYVASTNGLLTLHFLPDK